MLVETLLKQAIYLKYKHPDLQFVNWGFLYTNLKS